MGVYNQLSARQLSAAVDSILRQTFSDFEFIIYDDGSIPEVSERIKKLADLDDRIVVIGSSENNGLAFSLNRCIERARGRYLARMDADDEAMCERFEVQHAFLEEHREYDWCGTNALLFDDDGVWGETKRPEEPVREDYLRFSPYVHPSVMYRSSLFSGEGYSEVREALRCEDYEIFMRLFQMGYRGYNIQKPLMKYRVNRVTYHKRPFHECTAEMKIRYRSFARMDHMTIAERLFIIRPVVSYFTPRWLVKLVKRRGGEL